MAQNFFWTRVSKIFDNIVKKINLEFEDKRSIIKKL